METSLVNIVSTIAETSFPVAVAGYLLVRMEARLQALTEAISSLKHFFQDRRIEKRDV
jgi:hypothetical protein